MQIIMWNKRRLLIIITVIVLLYAAFYKKHFTYQTNVYMKNVRAEILWEFIADFSNTKKFLVPHMDSFTIVSESGNYDSWQYSVKYEETLPIWPYLKCYAHGDYSIGQFKNDYIINSNHKLCYFRGLFCSKSWCSFTISPDGKDSIYNELIRYDCPNIISSWCTSMANITRSWYIQNLKLHFNQKL